MARTGVCRLNGDGVSLLRKRYSEGRFSSVAAFCSAVGMPRSTYYELAGRAVWFEHATVTEKLQTLGISAADASGFIEFRDETESTRAEHCTAPAGNLPYQPTTFIGREAEIAAITNLLASNALVSLTGAGGCGKTRLAVETASRLGGKYRDGAWLIELAALDSPDAVVRTTLSTLGVQEEPGRAQLETLTTYLSSRSVLLVLDNCEHLASACASLAAAVMRYCSRAAILVTSRAPLAITGEIVWRVPPLMLPAAVSWHEEEFDLLASQDAMRLFTDRATAVCSGFELTRQNVAVVAELCHRLDGMPLAIELAAARMNALSVEEINARLDERFRLLTNNARTALPRQRTLRALMDWSYDLLTNPQRACLNRLSVFAGGWTLEAAEHVCGSEYADHPPGAQSDLPCACDDVLNTLALLIDNSLVLPHTTKATSRYSMLETVRQYARDRLEETGEGDSVRSRHVEFVVLLIEKADSELGGPAQGEALRRLDEEYDNIRTAFENTLAADNRICALRICAALGGYWWTRSLCQEGREWCMRAMEGRAGVPSRELAGALCVAGRMAAAQSDYSSAAHDLQECLRISRHCAFQKQIAEALYGIGEVAWLGSDYVSAQTSFEQSLELFSAQNNLCGMADSLRGLGSVAYHRGDYAGARARYAESLVLYRGIGNPIGIAAALNGLGNTAESQGDYDAARDYHEESLSVRREVGAPDGIAQSLCNLAIVAFARGDYVHSEDEFEASRAIYGRIGNRGGISFNLNKLGTLSYSLGDYAAALARFRQSLAIRREIGDRRGIASTLNNIGKTICRMGAPHEAGSYFEEGLEVGREIGNRYSMAASLEGLADLAVLSKDWGEAHRLYAESLTLLHEIGDRLGVASVLESMANLAVHMADSETEDEQTLGRAVCLWARADAIRREIGSPLPPVECERYLAARDSVRCRLGPELFQRCWRMGETLSRKDALEFALGSGMARMLH